MEEWNETDVHDMTRNLYESKTPQGEERKIFSIYWITYVTQSLANNMCIYEVLSCRPYETLPKSEDKFQ